jgi:hypothetical protein
MWKYQDEILTHIHSTMHFKADLKNQTKWSAMRLVLIY